MSIKRLSLPAILPGLLFATVVLAINGHWFHAPIIESSDLAANSLQVYHARGFHEMLGNYSRWLFHHPGPVFFYLLAAGEYLFNDLLHVVPAPFNAQLVTVVLINTALLFGSIEIFARHFTATLFRPLALTAAVLLIYNLNHPNSVDAVVSLWMPHVALFAFLFFASACASVAAGRVEHLPLLALGAMMMIHLHVAQFLFVGVLAPSACLAAALRIWREGNGWGRVRRHASKVLASVGIVILFLFPIVLELVLHRPNNLDHVREYLQRYPNPNQGLPVAGRYLLSFLTFCKVPNQLVYSPASGLLTEAAAHPQVFVYWSIFLAGAILSLVLAVRFPKLRSRIAGVVPAEIVVISLLFLYWANRITGEMYSFNGYFYNSVHLLGLFLIAGILSTWLTDRLPGLGHGVRRWAPLAWAVPFLAMIAVAGDLRNPDMGSGAVRNISAGLRSPETYHLVFQHDDWNTAVGVANQLARRRQPFCVSANWGYMFGYESVCTPSAPVRTVIITDRAWFDAGTQQLKLPVTIEADDATVKKDGFYPPESAPGGAASWSGRNASLTFTLQRDPGIVEYRVTITGSVLPERAVEVAINGRRLGVVDGIWKSAISFPAGRDMLHTGELNQMTFYTAKAGPIAGDPRELGFSLLAVQIEAVKRE